MGSREALRIIALEVVGVSNPDSVHDDEMLRWGKIREALQGSQKTSLEAPYTPVRAPDGAVEFRKCWNSGKGGHLCNKKCADEPPYGTTLEDLVAKYRQQQLEDLRRFDMVRRPWYER